jgi:hypothetical protein
LLKNLQQKNTRQQENSYRQSKQHEEDEDSRRPLIFSVAWDKKNSRPALPKGRPRVGGNQVGRPQLGLKARHDTKGANPKDGDTISWQFYFVRVALGFLGEIELELL